MKKLTLAILGAVSAFTMAPAAHAVVLVVTPAGGGGIFVPGCGADNFPGVPAAVATCNFSNTFNFTSPAGMVLVSATLSTGDTVPSNDANDLDFLVTTLNGMAFSNLTGANDLIEQRNLLNQSTLPGLNANTLFVSGTTGGLANYTASLAFAPSSAVPEPSTWALMLLGFGAVGYSLRRRPTYRRVQAV